MRGKDTKGKESKRKRKRERARVHENRKTFETLFSVAEVAQALIYNQQPHILHRSEGQVVWAVYQADEMRGFPPTP